MDFSKLKSLTIPEGVVTQIADASGQILWSTKPKVATITITGEAYYGYTSNYGYLYTSRIVIDGQEYTSAAVVEVPIGTEITCFICGTGETVSGKSEGYATATFNGEQVSAMGSTGIQIPNKLIVNGDININISYEEEEIYDYMSWKYATWGHVVVTGELTSLITIAVRIQAQNGATVDYGMPTDGSTDVYYGTAAENPQLAILSKDNTCIGYFGDNVELDVEKGICKGEHCILISSSGRCDGYYEVPAPIPNYLKAANVVHDLPRANRPMPLFIVVTL